MNQTEFAVRLRELTQTYEQSVTSPNSKAANGNGIYDRYQNPILTAAHAPIIWRYDLNPQTNPFLMERLGVNATFNAGAIEIDEKVLLCVRVEGNDRKSFFAIAESQNGTDNFRFWDYPVSLPETDDPETNVYDMRLVKHEDGWIYGLFCTERKDPNAPAGDLSSAIAQGGIARTRDLKTWQRLPDLKTRSAQQRNVVLHPEFVAGKYAFYTRPQDSFIEAGSGGGIGWGLAETIENAVVNKEIIVESRRYHTIKEAKNGLGPAPLKTEQGWLNLAHGVRHTAAGLRYVLYLFLCDLHEPWRITHAPGGHFLAPEGMERVGDVSNVAFSNGWIRRKSGEVLIYYASSDSRMHVASSTLEKLLDDVTKTPADPLRSAACVQQRCELIKKNLGILGKAQ